MASTPSCIPLASRLGAGDALEEEESDCESSLASSSSSCRGETAVAALPESNAKLPAGGVVTLPANSTFANYLADKPSFWRREHAAGGLAWDYPQSKVEKRELLVLHLLAEEQERKALRAALCASQQEASALAEDAAKADDILAALEVSEERERAAVEEASKARSELEVSRNMRMSTGMISVP